MAPSQQLLEPPTLFRHFLVRYCHNPAEIFPDTPCESRYIDKASERCGALVVISQSLAPSRIK